MSGPLSRTTPRRLERSTLHKLQVESLSCAPSSDLSCVTLHAAVMPALSGVSLRAGRGLMAAYEDIQRVYGCLGASDSLTSIFIGEHTHSFPMEDVAEIATFFCKHAGMPPPPDSVRGLMSAVGTPTGGGQVFAPELFAAAGDVASVPVRLAALLTSSFC